MTTATQPVAPAVSRLARERAAATVYTRGEWQVAVDGAGGEERAGWLLREVPSAGASPAALIIAHAAARLLDLEHDGPTAPT